MSISTSYENRNDRLWKALDRTQGWAVRMLTLPIPILSLLLLISLLGALPHSITDDSTARKTAICGAGFLGLLVFGWLSRKLPATSRPWTWVLFPLIFVIPPATIAAIFSGPNGFTKEILAIEALLLGSIVLFLWANSNKDVRNGSSEAALILWLLWFSRFSYLLFRHDDVLFEQIPLTIMQDLVAALRFSWIVLYCLAFAAFVLGGLAWRSIKHDEKRRGRARAAVRTSRLALALPTMGVLIVTLGFFSGVFVKTTTNKPGSPPIAERLFGQTIKGPLTPRHWPRWLAIDRDGAREYNDEELCPDSTSPNEYFKGVLVWSATLAFPVVLVLLVCGLVLLALWLRPSIGGELNPPRQSDNKSSRRLGSWLSRGLDASKIVTMLMWAAAVAVPVAFIVGSEVVRVKEIHEMFHPILVRIKQPLIHWTTIILLWIGGVAGSLAILTSLVKSGSSILGIVLDVDNYLRASPKDQTPRARIIERYVSLLRYLSEY